MTSTTQEPAAQTLKSLSPEVHARVQSEAQAFLEANPAQTVGSGLWICPGTVSLERDGWDLKVSGRFLYPPESPWNHVELKGKVSGITLGAALPTVGIATMFVDAEELEGTIDLAVNAGGVGPGGIHMDFKRSGNPLGFFAGGAAIEGLIIATGTGTFTRVD